MKPVALGLVLLGVLAVAGCPASPDDLCAKGTCDPAVDATSPSSLDAGPDGVSLPPDPCVDHPRSADCIDEKVALFVSLAADPNTADGTIAHPFASIQRAIERATGDKRRIYVCEGTYDERVQIGPVPVTLVGGLACDFRSEGQKPKIAPSTGIALGIAKVTGASVLDVVAVGVSDPSTKGSSAVAIFVTGTKDLLLRRVDASAGSAQEGAAGAAATANFVGQYAPSGINATSAEGADPPACGICKDGATRSIAGGGAGGTKTIQSGGAIPPVGTSNAVCNGNGADGVPPPAAKGGARPGTLREASWDTSTTAEKGGVGHPGQGGGGAPTGGGSPGGGSGGCGGCGGGGGGAGENGGSSFALLVYQSTNVTIDEGSYTAGDGGPGGRGGPGDVGQNPGPGGSGYCLAGGGGKGTGGGGGGGGAGGHSVAIGYLGDAPKTTGAKLAFGAAGSPGDGGDGGGGLIGGPKGEPGAGGTPAETLDLK